MTITIQDLVQREVYYCVSALVSDLCKLYANVPYSVQKETGTDYDELLNLCQRDDWETPVDWYIDHNMNRSDLLEALEAAGVDDPGVDVRADPNSRHRAWEDSTDKELRVALFEHLEQEDEFEDFAREHNIDPEIIEVYEHWLISGWLASRLEEKGEVVGRDICGLTIWGRCTTGQAISMDWVIQQIYKDLTGQEAE
jgi:hypothetical protein